MDDEAKVLFEMFPDLPEQTLGSILKNYAGDLSRAIDEALTIASLDVSGVIPSEVTPQEVWEDASLFQPAWTPPLEHDEGARPATTREGEVPVEHPRQNGGVTSSPPFAGSATPILNGSPTLPWENTTRYVIGSGELGLLDELQKPRRGAVVPLATDFLRLPDSPSGVGNGVLLETEPLIIMDDNGDPDMKPQAQLSPMVPLLTARGGLRRKGNGISKYNNEIGTPRATSLREPYNANANPNWNSDMLPVSNDDARLSVESSDSGWAGSRTEEATLGEVRNGRAILLPTAFAEGPTVNDLNSRPPVRGGYSGLNGEHLIPVRNIETASSAHRIATFRSGTKFRVAVDKGVTGLGITVKEVRDRFFVYKLKALADGSPGAAEEAGIQVGDELLGVEELDFGQELWDIDQLVSYMGELVGVVILNIMRGFGPLPETEKIDVENAMSHGVAPAVGEGETTNETQVVEGRSGGGGGHKKGMMGRAQRLVEVLEEEGLSQPLESADLSRLFCQISNRAKQWDSGELWLSVADLARRPSRDVVAALANQWQPGEPVGWDESDSSGDEEKEESPLPERKMSPGETGLGGWEVNVRQSDNVFAPAVEKSRRKQDESDNPAEEDLDEIGTALLGQPLFSDPLSVRGAALVAGGARGAVSVSPITDGHSRSTTGRRSIERQDGNTDGSYWSPWPQLAAFESKTARRNNTVVCTRGLRKALNVRVLGEAPPPPSSSSRELSGGQRKKAGIETKAENALSQSSTPYIVWVMDVESGAEWKVRRRHSEFAELREVCTGMRPSLSRLDFPSWLPEVKETPGMVKARRPRLEAYLQRLFSLLYMGPLHPSSTHIAHLLQDFLGSTPRVETLLKLQRSRPERELRQALQVRAWQVLRLPPLERAVATFVREAFEGPVSRNKKAMQAEEALKRLTEIMERLQYVVTEGCFDELREMVRMSTLERGTAGSEAGSSKADGNLGGGGGVGENGDPPDLSDLEAEDEALELISESVRRQVEAEVFVPVMGRLYELLRTEGPTVRLENAAGLGMAAARGKPQSFHDIPLRNLSSSSWNDPTKLMRTMGVFTLPCDKLDALVAVAHAIPALHRAEHKGEDASSLGADDFLPIFMYVLVNSNVEDLAAQAVILETLCDPKKLMGEAGFCLATLSAALQHLGSFAVGQSSRKGTKGSFLGRRN